MLPRCSIVKHNSLDNRSDMPLNFRFGLCQAPIALKSLTLRASTDNYSNPLRDADALVDKFCSSQCDSPAALTLHGPSKDNEIHGCRCSMCHNEKLDKAQKLKIVAINII